MHRTALLLLLSCLLLPLLFWGLHAYAGDALVAGLSAEQAALLPWVIYPMLGFALLCFVVSELTDNYSQVDKLWSITPPVYVWIITALMDWDSRLVLMSVLVTIWGIRLTYNFGRHGAYQWKFWAGHEDYRWAHVRQNPALQGPWRWRLFNLLFICLYQHALLLLIALPIVVVATAADRPLGLWDGLCSSLFLALVVLEAWADQQQWRFQGEKHRRLAAGEELSPPYSLGFIRQGLWAWSRHPNYFAEQSIWLVFYLFTIPIAPLNWSLVGGVLLMLLFQGSSRLSEGISAEKYPAYRDYQKQVPRFLPRPPRTP